MNSERTRRIRMVSSLFRVLTMIGLAVTGIGILAILIVNPDSTTVGMGHWHIKELQPQFSWIKRPLALLIFVFPIVALWRLHRLFSLTAKESYFTTEAVGHIKFLGYWMIAYGIASFGLQFLQLLSNSTNRDIKLGIDGYVFGGMLVLLLAWIMDEGREIQEEQHLTV